MWARDPALWIILAAVGAWIIVTHGRLPIVASGDGYSAYFPTYWAFQDGRGLAAFSFLAHGAGRAPGYPLLLFAASIFGPDVGRAVTIVAVSTALVGVALLYMLVARLAGRAGAALAVALFVTSDCFLHMTFVSTPDLAAFAVAMAAIAGAVGDPRSLRTTGALSGALAAAASLLRINYALLVIAVLIGPRALARRDRLTWTAAVVLGALVPLGAWAAVSLVTRGTIFWIPAGPTEVPSPLLHEALGVHGGLRDAFAADPIGLCARLAKRIFIAGPIEVARDAGGWLCVVGALTTAPALRAPRPPGLAFFTIAVGLAWLAIAPLHYEARYYPLQVAWLCVLAALGLEHVARRFVPDRATFVAWAAIALVLVVRRGAIERAPATQEGGAEIIAELRPLAEAASHLPGACVGAEEVGFRLTPLRWSLRRLGHTDLCCCGPHSGDAGFFRVRSHTHTTPEALALDLELVTTSTALGGVELYRARRPATP